MISAKHCAFKNPNIIGIFNFFMIFGANKIECRKAHFAFDEKEPILKTVRMPNKPVIALSTSYFRQDYADGYEMLCKCAELGFEYVELGHNTSMNLVEGILKAVKEGIVKVSSLHNFCPVPPFARPPAPNLYSPATSSKLETSQWRRHTLNTLSFAKEVGASRVVMHSGSLAYFFLNPKYSLMESWEAAQNAKRGLENLEEELSGGDLSEDEKSTRIKSAEENLKFLHSAYQKKLEKFVSKSEKKASKFHNRIFENLKGVDGEFSAADILLGVENRDGYVELPFDTMFADFTQSLAKGLKNVRPWIDIGHVKVKSLRGVVDFERFVEEASPNVCGWHLHDCNLSCHDHRAIGDGDIDFAFVKKFFKPESQIFTLELNYRVKEEDAVSSRKKVEDML